eukprot:scaffold47259_cov24-Tisochrysis_lutea.AAC.1
MATNHKISDIRQREQRTACLRVNGSTRRALLPKVAVYTRHYHNARPLTRCLRSIRSWACMCVKAPPTEPCAWL